jgi:prepilin-type N-terminal cleavage/methylation domain-containing protein
MAGFTMVELSVVVMILGILVVMGLPVFSEGQVGAKRNSCLDRQHVVFEAALLYCSDNVVPDGTINVSVLQPTFLQSPSADCPADLDGSLDDYTIIIQGNGPVDVTCNVMGDVHPWDPQ